MLPAGLSISLKGLFSICLMVAAMDVLAGEGRAALSFHSMCALASTLCAIRAVIGVLGIKM